MPHPSGQEIQTALLAWFADHKRILPWRKDPSLYGTWVSEIMLQQTTVAAVIPYCTGFMALFPDVRALASADEAEVLAAWSGLGYYRRARNLHKAARMIVEDLGGQLPSNRRQWLALPGVGAYTSGAIASIGLGEVASAVDANARRVITRWFCDNPGQAAQLNPTLLEKMAQEMIARQCPGQWNEAVMELGAVLCRAGSAHCQQCPVLDHCRAGLAGVAEKIPQGKKVKPPTVIAVAVIAVYQAGGILLFPPGAPATVILPGHWEVARKDTSGLHQGLWSLPSTPWYLDTPLINDALDEPGFVLGWLQDQLAGADVAFGAEVITRGPLFFHGITTYRLKVRVWEVHLKKRNLPNTAAILRESPVDHSEDGCAGIYWAGQLTSLSHKLPVSKIVTKALEPHRPRDV